MIKKTLKYILIIITLSILATFIWYAATKKTTCKQLSEAINKVDAQEKKYSECLNEYGFGPECNHNEVDIVNYPIFDNIFFQIDGRSDYEKICK